MRPNVPRPHKTLEKEKEDHQVFLLFFHVEEGHPYREFDRQDYGYHRFFSSFCFDVFFLSTL